MQMIRPIGVKIYHREGCNLTPSTDGPCSCHIEAREHLRLPSGDLSAKEYIRLAGFWKPQERYENTTVLNASTKGQSMKSNREPLKLPDVFKSQMLELDKTVRIKYLNNLLKAGSLDTVEHEQAVRHVLRQDPLSLAIAINQGWVSGELARSVLEDSVADEKATMEEEANKNSTASKKKADRHLDTYGVTPPTPDDATLQNRASAPDQLEVLFRDQPVEMARAMKARAETLAALHNDDAALQQRASAILTERLRDEASSSPVVTLTAEEKRQARIMSISERALLATKTRRMGEQALADAAEAKAAQGSDSPVLNKSELAMAKRLGVDVHAVTVNKAKKLANKKGA